ncbi:tyrosine-type recombinase/integrase [Bosea sp. PAMC 26642]|uniref:tyrosine-type recombinase/integrase n=1 Tax=Bosea sp. (strain PAMC 26642) TaxID=1792307 RepID=UPI00077010C8|nr:integrase arm-type DNA-binding domain-containing protein [Bosea sp. PAMC 26642]AMJ63176.1 integrase [Bosea sp. PAMC 26642]
MPLSDVAIRAAKPAAAVKKLSDGGGLQLWLMPSGAKLWRLAYRFAGKQKKLAIGPYPAIGLSDARAKRDEAKAHLVAGRDPSIQKQAEKALAQEAQGQTFAKVAAELLEKKRREGKAANTLAKLEWLYGLTNSSIGDRPVTEITAAEVLVVLRKAEGKGRLETAKRLRAVIGEVFRYAIATARAVNDPTFALRGAISAPVVKHRAAITDPVQLGGLMRAIEGFNGQPSTNAALKLMAYLFPRPGELRLAEWREFDLGNALWTIPAIRAKMRREHRVPLPRQALVILQDLQRITGGDRLVLPGYGVSGGEGRKVEQRPISENTLNGALRRMGYGQDEMSSHGFRAAASSLLNESGKFSSDAIERALAHQDPDAVRRAYARGEHWKERLTMAQWWADQLDAWRDGARVISFGPKAG